MSINSKEKGKRGEREASRLLNSLLNRSDIKRGQQFKGTEDSPDVAIEDSSLHVEVKRVERLNLADAIEQMGRDCGNKTPFLMHRRNNSPWLVTIKAIDLIRFCEEILRIRNEEK